MLQTIHRLFVTVLAHRRYLRKRWLYFFIALIQFIIPMMMLLPALFEGHFAYIPDGKMCYIAFNDLFGVLYPSVCFYFGPLIIQLLLSYWILQYVSRETQAGRAQINVRRRVEKERRILIRLFIPVLLIIGVGLIYFVFVFGTWISSSSWQIPPYALHLSLLGISAAIGIGMLINIIIHKKIRKIISSTLCRLLMIHRQNTVHIIRQQHATINQGTGTRTVD
ncbi:unnamed protein product [Adineta steineri]|uniref:G-protein coupled receptors family 1 profile domain-containing protein n=1 Tax=Adineta steineri TaxID=433720 RepID=A0A819YXY6_9BILA|nr:unnamed protein product [Adineta steineri]CAF4165368.1 unnamed protein product [Adineta steineri]